jgi:hypothetical protein
MWSRWAIREFYRPVSKMALPFVVRVKPNPRRNT